MVFLDVVYNHFGPEGNYLGRYAPQFFTPAQTPWGNAIDYERPEVRRFAVENALHWLSEFRFDGLRLDAVHAIAEPGRTTLLREMSEAVGTLASQTARHIHLVLENDANQASLLDPLTDPPRGKYRAQWNDDYHHAFHVLLTGETQGYYGDYRDAARHVARALAEGFAYQGEPSPHRDGETRGETDGEPARHGLRQFPAEPRPDRQPRAGRTARRAGEARGAGSGARHHAARAGTAAAVHGRANGARASRFRSSAISRASWPKRCARAAARNSREAYVQHGDEVPDPLAEQTVRLATLDWTAVDKPQHRGAARTGDAAAGGAARRSSCRACRNCGRATAVSSSSMAC